MKLRTYWYKWIFLFLPLFLIACDGGKGDTSSLAKGLTLTATSNVIQVGTSQYTRLQAKVTKENGQPLSGASVKFETDLGSFDASSSVLSKTVQTDIKGIAEAKLYPGDVDGTAQVSVFSGGYVDYKQVTILPSTNSSVGKKLGKIGLTPTATEITADGSSTVAIDIVSYEQSTGNSQPPLANVPVTLTTTAGLLSTDNSTFTAGQNSLTVTTDANGQARIYLQSTTTTSQAVIQATSNGVNATTQVDFIPGPPAASNSSITASPSALAADGNATSTITVLLLDANNNLVADGTPVTLQVTDGAITSENPQTTTLGRATFTYQAPTTAGMITVSTVEYPGLQDTLTVGSQSSPDPANIAFDIANSHLYVKGVGKTDSTSIVITVRTAAGDLIADPNNGVNNLKVRFKSRPNGGERISGSDASGTVVNSDASGEIAIRTANGVATVNLESGTLPGVVELEAEALDPSGNAFAPPVISAIPQISISSGPPKSIILSYPVEGAVTDMGSGVYRRNGSVFVTDRYGNAVPDGTVINLGVLDSVIISNNSATGFGVNATADNNASTTANNADLTDGTNSNFNSASITRNDTARFVQQNDRVLLLNSQSEDKSRFVSSIGSNTLTTNKDYRNTANGLKYVIGASELGAQIYGYDETQGTSASPSSVTDIGQAKTQDGRARIFLQYPADKEHILTGCYSDPTLDIRATAAPAGSAQVWVVAESSETGATTVDNRACFAAKNDWQLINESGVESIASTTNITLRVEDALQIPLPFVSLSTSVAFTTNTGGLNISVGNCSGRSDKRTDESGRCTLPITVSGGASGDSATVTIGTGGNANPVTISVAIP